MGEKTDSPFLKGSWAFLFPISASAQVEEMGQKKKKIKLSRKAVKNVQKRVRQEAMWSG